MKLDELIESIARDSPVKFTFGIGGYYFRIGNFRFGPYRTELSAMKAWAEEEIGIEILKRIKRTIEQGIRDENRRRSERRSDGAKPRTG